MSVANTKSGPITNRDASPAVLNNAGVMGGVLRGFVGTVETVSGDSINSTYRIAQIPSNAVMHSLRLYCDDIGSNTVADVGLYRTTADGGAVVDQDHFASAVSLKDGAVNGSDILHEAASSGMDISDAEKPIWSQLGLSADPCLMYDLVATLTVAADAAGTLTIKGSYAL